MKWDRAASASVAVVGTVATHLWGGADEILIALITFMALDYLLGVMCGYKGQELSSDVGFWGIFKKVTILIVVAVAVTVDSVTLADGLIRALVIWFYLGMEGISIMENAAVMGVPVPDKLKDSLVQLKNGNKKSNKKDDETLE